eukprot:14440765-Alexandrium_andersonii.AAC.1
MPNKEVAAIIPLIPASAYALTNANCRSPNSKQPRTQTSTHAHTAVNRHYGDKNLSLIHI